MKPLGREEVRVQLVEKTKCDIQHDGWPCGTCFFAIDTSLTNADWRALLRYRGDYPDTEFPDRPDNWRQRVERIATTLKEHP